MCIKIIIKTLGLTNSFLETLINIIRFTISKKSGMYWLAVVVGRIFKNNTYIRFATTVGMLIYSTINFNYKVEEKDDWIMML